MKQPVQEVGKGYREEGALAQIDTKMAEPKKQSIRSVQELAL
jgi:hypothetical protein